MSAEVALLDRPKVVVKVERVVGAGLHAGPAADAGITIDVDDPVRPFRKSVYRADRDARRIRAMVAPLNQKVTLDPGVFPDLHILDGCTEVAYRNVVLLLAGGRAGMTADARLMVDDKAIMQATAILLLRPGYLMANKLSGRPEFTFKEATSVTPPTLPSTFFTVTRVGIQIPFSCSGWS